MPLPSDTELLALATSYLHKVTWFGDYLTDPGKLEGPSDKLRPHPARQPPESLNSSSQARWALESSFMETSDSGTPTSHFGFAEPQTELGGGGGALGRFHMGTVKESPMKRGHRGSWPWCIWRL